MILVEEETPPSDKELEEDSEAGSNLNDIPFFSPARRARRESILREMRGGTGHR